MKNKSISITIIVIILLTIGMAACKQQPQNQWVLNTSDFVTPPEDRAFSTELLKGNIETTDLTVMVEIKKARVEGANGGKPEPQGYVNHIYYAKVLETFKGKTENFITYSEMADAEMKPSLKNYPIIVSLCSPKNKKYHIPDNGFVSPATASLVKYAKTLKNEKKSKKKSVDSEGFCRD
ncbi:MAG: hypothetical protein GY754_42720 [bacterium]|nr:hypothetical protein [bacterium]